MSVEPWEETRPAACAAWFGRLRVPWWFAGGWALDLFLGRQTRPHRDIDVGVLRRDLPAVLEALSSWQVFASRHGELTCVADGSAVMPDVNSLWCRRPGSDRWSFELLIDDAAGDVWQYRRDPTVRRRLDAVVREDPSGLPYLAPEVQLLYKARLVRPRDMLDFVVVLPRLDAIARLWLHDALGRTEGDHLWLEPLNAR